MKRTGIYCLIISIAIGSFYVGRYVEKNNNQPHHNMTIKEVREKLIALNSPDHFSQLSDAELISSCKINGYDCSEVAKKLNEIQMVELCQMQKRNCSKVVKDNASISNPDDLIGIEHSLALYNGGSRYYHLTDGRGVWYDQDVSKFKCEEDGRCYVGDLFGSITIIYSDGRKLTFDRNGKLKIPHLATLGYRELK